MTAPLKHSLWLICAVVALIGDLGCGNARVITVTMVYRVGTRDVEQFSVPVLSSSMLKSAWPDGVAESLEVTWDRAPQILFHEVWIGVDSLDPAERELLGYTVDGAGPTHNRLNIIYPSNNQQFVTINLRDVPSKKRSQVQHVTLVHKIDDSPVDLNPLLFGMTANLRAWRLATHPIDGARDGIEAVRLAKIAVQQSGGSAYFLDTLACAYAESGDFASAVETEKKAIEALTDSNAPKSFTGNNLEDAARFHTRLELFESSQKFRSPLSDF